MKNRDVLFTTSLVVLSCLGIVSGAQAVSPPPDGGYPGGNTAEGQSALLSVTTGAYNTAVGLLSLRSNTTGKFNTAIGAGTLLANTADENTATGAGALVSNSTGEGSTASGAFALFGNTTGNGNTATGFNALFGNTIGSSNTATGVYALFVNTTGDSNTASGAGALSYNTVGAGNTAIGAGALFSNTTGSGNTAIGGSAGFDQTTGSNNVYIGSSIGGLAGENNACRIASIFGQTVATATPVFIDSGSKLGTTTSSKRFKEDIKPMGNASEAILALKPVTFRYKKAIDPAGTSQFGLVAEEVEKVNPDLVVRDKEGKPYSVRYDQVYAMLLNEFLKEHRRVEEHACDIQVQQATIAQLETAIRQQRKDFQATVERQQRQIAALVTRLEKVNAQIELSKPAPETVANNQ